MTNSVPFRRVTAFAIGGGWGSDAPADGHQRVRVIRGTDFARIAAGAHDEVPERFERESKVAKRRLMPGDIVLEISGGSAASGQTTGRSIYVSAQLLEELGQIAIPASFCRLVRVDATLVRPRFAYYALQDMYQSRRAAQYEKQSTGISNFQFEYFLDAEQIWLPSMSEQDAVIELLGALDDKIELNRRMSETLGRLARSIYDEATSRSESVRESSLAELADEHKVKVNPQEFPDETFLHYSLPAFDAGRSPVVEVGVDIKSSKTLVPTGAVLVSRLNPRIPRVWLPDLEGQRRRAIASTEFLVLTPRAPWTPALLYAAASARQYQESLVAMATGTSGSHQRVRPKAALGVTLVVPPEALVPTLQESVGPMLDRIQIAHRETGVLQQLRDTLLPRLISGELRIPDAERIVSEAT